METMVTPQRIMGNIVLIVKPPTTADENLPNVTQAEMFTDEEKLNSPQSYTTS